MPRTLTIATAAGRLRIRVADADTLLVAGSTSAAPVAGRTTRITASAPAASGGTPPYTYRVQYALDDGTGVPGPWAYAGVYGAAETPAGTAAPADVTIPGLGPGQTYWVRHEVADSAGSPATATSTPASVALPASDLAGFDTWWDRMTTRLEQANFLPTLEAQVAGSADLNTLLNHDGLYNAVQGLRMRPGDPQLAGWAAENRRLFRDGFLMAAAPPGFVQGFFNFPEGVALDWEYFGDTVSRDALIALRAQASYVNFGATENNTRTREAAYAIATHVESARLGLVAWDATRVEELVHAALHHCDRWAVNSVVLSDEEPGFQPFMFGLTTQSLIRYLEYLEANSATDARIVPALARVAIHLWERFWTESIESFYLIYYPDGSNNGSVAWMSTIEGASFLGWLYKRTGDPYFQVAGDAAWTATAVGGAGAANYFSPKEYNEGYRYGYRYLEWREGTPGTDNQYLVLDGPILTTGVAGSTLSFRCKPLANFTGTVTPTDSGAGGSFAPTSLTWTGTREIQAFTYTLPAVAGAYTVAISGTAPLTATPASQSVVALDPAGLATGFTFTGTPSAPAGTWSGPLTFTPNGSFVGHLTPDDGTDWAVGPVLGAFDGDVSGAVIAWAGPPTPRVLYYKRSTAGTSTLDFVTAGFPGLDPVSVIPAPPDDPDLPAPITFTAS